MDMCSDNEGERVKKGVKVSIKVIIYEDMENLEVFNKIWKYLLQYESRVLLVSFQKCKPASVNIDSS